MVKFIWTYKEPITSEEEFNNVMRTIEEEGTGRSFVVLARLWYQEDNSDRKPIMVEYRVPTKELHTLNGDEFPFLEAYKVEKVGDVDCTGNYDCFMLPESEFSGLEGNMLDYAKEISNGLE